MNSIESYSPPKVTSLDSDDKKSQDGAPPDAAALETLRALMGGIVPQQQQTALNAGTSDKEVLSGLLEALLAEDDLPPSLTTLIASLQSALAGGAALSDVEAAAKMKALLQELNANAAPEAQRSLDLRTALAQALSDSLAEPEPVRVESGAIETPNLGNSILQSLGSQSSAAVETAVQVNGVPTAERIEQVSSLMSQMADRVLVTDPLHGQAPEVRIKLADNIMPGTEVRVWREDGGQLRVEFDTVSPYWARVLNEASPLLAQRLNDRLSLPEPVQVWAYHAGEQPEDGRSRNRHTPWDLAQQSSDEQ